jgi:hypothetical protein
VVVATVRKAGFELEATSELNANPADTKDYPFGVWTLPPGRLSVLPNRPALTAEQRAHYEGVAWRVRQATLSENKCGLSMPGMNQS